MTAKKQQEYAFRNGKLHAYKHKRWVLITDADEMQKAKDYILGKMNINNMLEKAYKDGYSDATQPLRKEEKVEAENLNGRAINAQIEPPLHGILRSEMNRVSGSLNGLAIAISELAAQTTESLFLSEQKMDVLSHCEHPDLREQAAKQNETVTAMIKQVEEIKAFIRTNI